MWPRFPKWSCLTKPQKYPKKVLPKPPANFGEIQKVKVGPNALGDSDGKLVTRYWVCYQEGANVLMRGALNDLEWSLPTIIFQETDLIETLDFSFDQLGRELVFYKVGTELRLWFFDSSLEPARFVKIVLIADGNYPHVNFDRVENTNDPISDVIICYVKNDTIYKRIQRDRFAIEYNTGVSHPGIKIESSGMTEGNRFQIVYNYPDLRDGAFKEKVYETTTSVFKQLQYKNLEIGFTLSNTPNDCELKEILKGRTAYLQPFTILANFGIVRPDADSPTNNENSLLVRFIFFESSNQIRVEIRRDQYNNSSGDPTAAYYMGLFDDFRFSSGVYILRFTQISASPIAPTKRLELIKDGITIIDETVLDIESRTGGFDTPSPINKLRFGSYAIPALDSSPTYLHAYPAKFTNMYCIYDGVRTDWPVNAVEGVNSIPSGNPIVIKFKGEKNITFY